MKVKVRSIEASPRLPFLDTFRRRGKLIRHTQRHKFGSIRRVIYAKDEALEGVEHDLSVALALRSRQVSHH
jgi:hypothetical protein